MQYYTIIDQIIMQMLIHVPPPHFYVYLHDTNIDVVNINYNYSKYLWMNCDVFIIY